MSNKTKRPRHMFIDLSQRLIGAASMIHDGNAMLCGSMRRHASLVSDLDIVIAHRRPYTEFIMDLFGAKEVTEGVGPRRSFEIMQENVSKYPFTVDVWTVAPEHYGSACLHASGPGTFNIIMRRWAKYKGMRLDMFGVHREGKIIASETEKDCFEALGLPYMDPFERGTYMKSCEKMLIELNMTEF